MKFLNTLLILAFFAFAMSCGGKDESSQNEEVATTESEENSEETPANELSLLEQVFQIKKPDSLEVLEAILGKAKMVERIAPTTDPYQSSTWEWEDGTIIWFDNAQLSGINIETKAQEPIATPLELTLNQSLLDDSKERFADLKKSNSNAEAPAVEVWKIQQGNTWYFLFFNKDKVLVRIKIAALDLDTVN